MVVNRSQRFTRESRCPVCCGNDAAPRGQGLRCFGFLSDDGGYAHCTREDLANGLPVNHDSSTFAHRMTGLCDCGVQHGRIDKPVKSRIVKVYDYRDPDGQIRHQVVRFEPKAFKQRRPGGKGGWIWNLKGVKTSLYRLPEVLAADHQEWVFIAEGEKDVDRLVLEGLLATTSSGGARKWRRDYGRHLKGRKVAVLEDNDKDGRAHGARVAQMLFEVAAVVKVIRLDALPEKGDASDWLDAGGSAEQLRAIVEDTPVWSPAATNSDTAEEAGNGQRKSQADRIVEHVEASGTELFHDLAGDGWARIPLENHKEIWNCRSKNFRRWLSRLFWSLENKAPNSQAIQSALNVIEAKARFDGEKHELSNRVAFHGNAIWYDLGDSEWRAVRIDSKGWNVVTAPPILFRRHAHQLAQVEPQRGGELGSFLDFANLNDEGQRLLLLAYLASCLVPDIPHPIPVLYGPQGASKTTLFRMLRLLIDPSQTETLTFPKNIVELIQQLSHHWAPYYDNITFLSVEMSDALCRATTGAGFSKRELYSDDDDIIYSFRRCCGLNGINIAAHQPDLLDRCLLFGLEPIAPSDRKPEKDIWDQFQAMQPRLLGAVFETLSQAMAIRPSVKLQGLPRMADFALWGCAIAQALDYDRQQFLDALEKNFDDRNDEVIAGNPVALLISSLMAQRSIWEGTASELLGELGNLTADHGVDTRARSWPKAANTLTRRLNEIRPNLAAAGIKVNTEGRTAGRRILTIRKMEKNTVTTVTTVTKPLTSANLDDDTYDDRAIGSQTSSRGKGLGIDANDGCDGNDGTFPILNLPASCSRCGGTESWRSAHGDLLCQRCGTNLGSDAPNSPDGGAA